MKHHKSTNTRVLIHWLRILFGVPALLLRVLSVKTNAGCADSFFVWFLLMVALTFLGWPGLLIGLLGIVATYIPPAWFRVPKVELVKKGVKHE